jgi:hypothetical protein
VPLELSPQAVDVLRRALDAGRMDPARVGVRLTLDRSGALRTGFATEPEPGEETILAGGVRLFAAEGLDGTLDVADEHDRLILRR